MYYYDIHVFLSRSNGYSIGLKSDRQLSDDEAIAEAVKQKRFPEEGDESCVDTVDEIDEKDYFEMFGEF